MGLGCLKWIEVGWSFTHLSMVCIRTWLDSDNPTSFVSNFHALAFWLIISHNTTYLVDSIRPVLCLQAESAVLQISKTTLSCYRTIQEIGSVELDSWLARRNVQNTSTGWVTDPRTNSFIPVSTPFICSICVTYHLCGWGNVMQEPGSVSFCPLFSGWRQTEVVVKPFTRNFLQSSTNQDLFSKIERCTFHSPDLSCEKFGQQITHQLYISDIFQYGHITQSLKKSQSWTLTELGFGTIMVYTLK